ncbi:hypothetical protein D3C79_792790 [compost metagenome]
MLMQPHAEQPTRRRINLQAATGKRVIQCRYQVFNLANLDDGLQRRGKVTPVMMQHRRARPQLRLAAGCVAVDAEVIVEAPAVDERPQLTNLRRLSWPAHDVEKALAAVGMLIEHRPTIAFPRTNHGVLALNQ